MNRATTQEQRDAFIEMLDAIKNGNKVKHTVDDDLIIPKNPKYNGK